MCQKDVCVEKRCYTPGTRGKVQVLLGAVLVSLRKSSRQTRNWKLEPLTTPSLTWIERLNYVPTWQLVSARPDGDETSICGIAVDYFSV